jgi:hypothetical protein
MFDRHRSMKCSSDHFIFSGSSIDIFRNRRAIDVSMSGVVIPWTAFFREFYSFFCSWSSCCPDALGTSRIYSVSRWILAVWITEESLWLRYLGREKLCVYSHWMFSFGYFNKFGYAIWIQGPWQPNTKETLLVRPLRSLKDVKQGSAVITWQ